MGAFLSFVIGVIVGVIVAWWFFARRDAESRDAMEAGWKKKLEHVEAEVRRADAAHEETKEKLRRLEQQRLAESALAQSAPSQTPPPESPSAPPATPPSGEAERNAQARRRIDAKLAQLPAGSTARQRLLKERAALDGKAPAAAPPPAAGKGEATGETPLFAPPSATPDDLERIRGIGPVLKARLNKLGVTTFAQIAAFTDTDLERLDEVLDFKGRIKREGWVEQAKALADSDRL